MKILVCTAVCILFVLNVNAQFWPDSAARRRAVLVKQNMFLLSAWGAGNITAGLIGTSNGSGVPYYRSKMNTYWGAANLGIGIIGLQEAGKQARKGQSFEENLAKQRRLEKIVLFNGALDLVYLGTALYLNTRGNRLDKDDLKGYGQSLFLQGGFLLAFDIFQYLRYRQAGKMLENQTRWHVSAGPGGIGAAYVF